MNLVYGSFCPLHEGNKHCPCRTLTTNASIWTAAELGDAARVSTLIREKGRSPNALDPHGYTPLHLAAQQGRLTVVRFLLEAGANPDGVSREEGGCGATPLHRAAYSGQLPCVRALLSAGADPHPADASFLDMKTPLHKAVDQCHREIAVALMDAGADPNATDAAGNSPMDVLFSHFPSTQTAPCPCYCPGKIQVDQGKGSRGESGRAAATVAGLGRCHCAGGRCDGHEFNARRGCYASTARGGGSGSGYDKKEWKSLAEALERYGGERGQRPQRGNGDLCVFANNVSPDDRRTPPDGESDDCKSGSITQRDLEQETTGSSLVSLAAVAPTRGVGREGCDSSISFSAAVVESEPYNGTGGKQSVYKYSHGHDDRPAHHDLETNASAQEYPPPPPSWKEVKSQTGDQSLERGGQVHNREVVSRGKAPKRSVVHGVKTGADDVLKRHTSGSPLVGETGVATAPEYAVDRGTIRSSGDSQGSAAGGMPGDSMGVPCGECRLPKVVMVRASCCGGLICKSCVRNINLRRELCRRCGE